MLDKLYVVQSKDLEIDVLETEKKQVPPELTETEIQHKLLTERLTAKEKQHSEARQLLNTNELELETLSASKRRAMESSLNASSAKEASQFQNQEIQFATRIQEVEEDTMPLMERMETVQGELDSLKEQLAEITPKLAEMTSAEAARVAELDQKMATMKRERDVLAADIPASLLKQYSSIRRSKRGIGLAPIVNGERCGGCNVKLPIHVLQKAKGDESGKVRCPSCGRILWARVEEPVASE